MRRQPPQTASVHFISSRHCRSVADRLTAGSRLQGLGTRRLSPRLSGLGLDKADLDVTLLEAQPGAIAGDLGRLVEG